jgi:hypothetical protein
MAIHVEVQLIWIVVLVMQLCLWDINDRSIDV